jgi:NuA3 HAT complex component NTO1
MEYYAVTMAGRQWGDSQSAAMALPDENDMNDVSSSILPSGNLPRVNLRIGNKRKREQTQKTTWKLSSGAPIIPHVIYTTVVDFLSYFNVHKKKEFVAEACKYWTLKREARRGASLLKRLQLQMNSFTSVEVIRKNYVSMGFVQGTQKLDRRREFAEDRVKELEQLKKTTELTEKREKIHAEDAEIMRKYLDLNYFPEIPLMRKVLDEAEKYAFPGLTRFEFMADLNCGIVLIEIIYLHKDFRSSGIAWRTDYIVQLMDLHLTYDLCSNHRPHNQF